MNLRLVQTISTGEENYATDIDFSPDGLTLASSSRFVTVCLWEVKTGNNIAIMRRHSTEVWGVRFSPNGELIASCGDDGVRLWDRRTGQQIEYFNIGSASGISFSPKGFFLAFGDRGIGGVVQIWNIKKENKSDYLVKHMAQKV